MQRHAWVLALLLPGCADDGAPPTTSDTTGTTSTTGADTKTSFVPTTSAATTTDPSTTSTTTSAVDTTTEAPSTATTADPSTTTADSSTTAAPDTTSTTDIPDTTGSTTDAPDTTTAGPTCGNGIIDPGEACDDGNDNDDDDCRNTCTFHECGDAEVGPNEPCDDGNDDNTDACTNTCNLPICGDGFLQPGIGETCDDGVNNNGDTLACTAACAQATCGDGLVWQGEEECDDGNADDDDFCASDCVAATCSDGQQNGAETDIDCGGFACDACPFLLLLGGNASKSLGAHYDNGAWTFQDIPVPAVDAPDLAVTTDQRGLGLLRYTKLNDPKDQQLHYVTWQAGVWSAPQQLAADTTRAAPTLYAAGTAVHAAFQGLDYQYYYAFFAAGLWSPAAEPIGSYGPGPGSLVDHAGKPALVYPDGADSNRLKPRVRTAPNQWTTLATLDPDTNSFDHQPAAAALLDDTVVAVFARNNGGQLRASFGFGPALDVPGAQTSAAPAVTGIAGGDVVLAFRGLDGRLYVAQSDGVTWDPPVAVLPNNAQIFGAPAVAPGIDGAAVELVYLDLATRRPTHVRRTNGAWSAPVTISTTPLERLALDRLPLTP